MTPDEHSAAHPDEPYPERRHQQPGRRAGDSRAYGESALFESDERLFATWTVGRATRWLTLIGLAAGTWMAVWSYAAAKIATRQEVTVKLDSIKQDAKAFRGSTDVRFGLLEARQHDAEAVHQLLIPMARLQCLQMRQWESGTLTDAAGLPCDSLLRRVRPR